MKRIGVVLVLLLVAAVGAGCGRRGPSATPPPSAAPAGSGSAAPSAPASAAPSASASGPVEFTVDGAGPYQLGATLAALQAAASVEEVASGAAPCPESTTARGTGAWRDIRLSFHKDGTLYLAVNRSEAIPTPSGAWLGTTLAQLKTIYASVEGEELAQGTKAAFLVTTVSGRGILFDLDAGRKVSAMTAGEGLYLRSTYLEGKSFC